MGIEKLSWWQQMARHVRIKLLAGLFFLIPAGITLWVLYSLFLLMDSASEPLIRAALGHPLPGIGFILTLAALYVIGLLTSYFIGQKIAEFIHGLMANLPGVNLIYVALRQLARVLVDPNSPALKRVVFIRFPSRGMLTVGFVTSVMTVGPLGRLVGVYIPTPPNPITGNLVLVRERDVIATDLSLEEGLKISFSAGVLWPERALPLSAESTQIVDERAAMPDNTGAS